MMVRRDKQHWQGKYPAHNMRCDTFTTTEAIAWIRSQVWCNSHGCNDVPCPTWFSGAAHAECGATTTRAAVLRAPSPRWLGMSLGDALGMTGYPDAVRSIERIASAISASDLVKPPQSIKRVRAWSDDDGELDLDRYRSDCDKPFATRRRVPRHSVGKIVHLTCAFGGNRNQRADALQYSGAALVAVANLLESAGYRCEITAINCATGVYNSGEANSASVIPIKAASDPLDSSALALVVANPAFFRLVMYRRAAGINTLGCRYSPSLGSTTNTFATLQGDINIPNVYSLDAAIAAAQTALQQLEH